MNRRSFLRGLLVGGAAVVYRPDLLYAAPRTLVPVGATLETTWLGHIWWTPNWAKSNYQVYPAQYDLGEATICKDLPRRLQMMQPQGTWVDLTPGSEVYEVHGYENAGRVEILWKEVTDYEARQAARSFDPFTQSLVRAAPGDGPVL